MSELKIISVNCQGLGSQEKRKDVIKFLKSKKCDVYCLQDTHFVEDIHNIVKSEWGFDKCFFSSYASNARGTAIIFNNTFDFKVHEYVCDENGNYVILNVTLENTQVTLVNIYGPNRDYPDFYKLVLEKASNFGNENYIICGDFNFILNPKIDCKYYKEDTINNPNARKFILETIEELDLLDIYRELHPDTHRYTWRKKTPRKMARLDFFLISNGLFNCVHECNIDPSYRTDHSIVMLSLKFQEYHRGKGLWKFNNSLLYDKEFVAKIKKTISKTKLQYCLPVYNIEYISDIPDDEINFLINDQLFLEVLLMEIRGESISHSAFVKKSRNNKEKDLMAQIQGLEEKESEIDISHIEELHKELETIRLEKLKGAMIRSKVKWIDEGEKPTEYFCNLEKRNYTSKIIQRIETEDGETITKQEEILEGICEFYETLYQSKTEDTQEWEYDKVFDNTRKLSVEEKMSLEGDISYKEAVSTLKNLNNNTSPGSDGYTTEFFKFFWRDLGHFVVRS